ncbi:MAG: hypothetical protein PHS92_03030 [Candidatus Gracilibacteria bacterium]|nr:hypothetical protein [Candidatus Gracilibacteria bacterium]
MKRIFILFLIILSFSGNGFLYAADCTYNGSVTSSFNNCMPKGALEAKENKSTGNGFWGNIFKLSSNNGGSAGYTVSVAKNKIVYATQKLVIAAGILAVGGVAFSGMLFVLGLGEAEKMKKAKGALKWSLLGFMIAIISQQLMNATINLVFSLSN